MNKKIYTTFISLIILLTLTVNIFPKQQNNSSNLTSKNNVYGINGIFNHARSKTYSVTGELSYARVTGKSHEEETTFDISGIFDNIYDKSAKVYYLTGIFPKDKTVSNIDSPVYKITGILNSNFSHSGKTYFITGRNLGFKKTGYLTKTQKAKLEYLEMEEESKIIALENELAVRRRLLDEEFAKQNFSEYSVTNLLNKKKNLNNDLEQIKFDKKRKTRYLLTQEQYIQYQHNLEKKQKKKKK
ncbi:MAG: hypothetical protein WC234_00415 [Endomicrobiaceae bacterium]